MAGHPPIVRLGGVRFYKGLAVWGFLDYGRRVRVFIDEIAIF